MKRESKLLHEKSLDSLFLAIEHFNRPTDRGRVEAVLILLDRAFELLLKASIVHRQGRIRETGGKNTIGFEKCVQKCLSEKKLSILKEEEALTIQMINSLRDAAQHYIIELGEQELYLFSQAGVTLYNDIQGRVFGFALIDQLPSRVLPVTTSPPQSLAALIESEIEDVKLLLKPGARRQIQARARLRPLAIIEASLAGRRTQPDEGDVDGLLKSVRKGTDWRQLFPGVASLNLSTEGTGLAVSLRLTKNEGEPVVIVPEGTPGATAVAIRKVDKLAFYNLGLQSLAEKCNLGNSRALAVIHHMGIQDDPDCFAEFNIGSQHFKRYSHIALDRIKKGILTLNMDEVWARHKPKGKGRARARAGSD